jgi:DNA end-binding protein Ku
MRCILPPKLPAEMVKLGQQIIETKSVAFDPAMLEDHYRNALVRILRKKQAKMPAPPAPVASSRENVSGAPAAPIA